MHIPSYLISIIIGSTITTAENPDAVIWNSISDSIALQTVEGAEETCLSGKAYGMPDEGEGDYLKILPNK